MIKHTQHTQDTQSNIHTHNESSTSSVQESSPQSDNDKHPAWVAYAFVCILIALVCAIAWGIGVLTHKPMDFDSVYNRTLAGEVTALNYKYNNFAFVRQSPQGLWITRAYKQGQEYELSFYYGPKEVEFIPVQENLFKTIIDAKKIYLVQDESLLQDEVGPAKGAIASIEFGKIVGNRYNILNKQTASALSYPVYPQTSAQQQNTSVPNTTQNTSLNTSQSSSLPETKTSLYPVVTCEQATNQTVVVLFALGNETVVRSLTPSTCILIQGKTPNELIASATAFTYSVMGIMR
jgi:hypothetical protein